MSEKFQDILVDVLSSSWSNVTFALYISHES